MPNIDYAHIDHFFAINLLGDKDHPLYSFCVDLMKASRESHLFIERLSLHPSIENILEKKNSPIIREGSAYYLRRNYFHEQEISMQLAQRISLLPLALNIPIPNILNSNQKKTFKLLNTSPFFLITGGPGSGKSFVAKSIVEEYKKKYPEKKVICTAPTGKALSALSSSNEDSATIHKLLGIKEGFDVDNRKKFIICDLLIVDECSMISPQLFNMLLSSLLDSTQIILIGDPHQLPPISGASIFYNFTKISRIDNIQLTVSMRSNKKPILSFSQAILKEDEETISQILSKEEDITLKPLSLFSNHSYKKGHIILTPFRKGPYGSLSLNDKIYTKKELDIPILITKNDKITNLTNGDIGYLRDGIAYFKEKNITISHLMLPEYEKAFALSIHKSQGSEFDHISIILPDEAICFQKELLFTAITRAKKSIDIYGSFETLITLVKNKLYSSSNLSKKVLEQLDKAKE